MYVLQARSDSSEMGKMSLRRALWDVLVLWTEEAYVQLKDVKVLMMVY